jgi:Fe-S cluster assembly iron-binding protein IscA
MIEVTKNAADAFRQVIAEPGALNKKIRVTFDGSG